MSGMGAHWRCQPATPFGKGVRIHGGHSNMRSSVTQMSRLLSPEAGLTSYPMHKGMQTKGYQGSKLWRHTS